MPRYFFDLTDGSREPDEIGTELRDRDAAQVEAIRFIGEVLKHEPNRLDHGTLRVNVREEDVALPFRVAVGVERDVTP